MPWGLRLLDVLIVLAFLGVAFLLGVFPLNDTDFWWHLKTGDLIRESGEVPGFDPFLYGGPEKKLWIDLHWGFQVLVSLGYERGGVVLLNLVKCAISALAVCLLITARRRDWPVWAMALGWLPALLVLGGRMYIRPETLTLLYLSGFLAILFRWKRHPWLALGLPLIQLLWVNTQGLFVLGPLVVSMALIDAAVEPGAFAKERQGWWRIVLGATAATGVACLFNPYGLLGALFPIQLLGTMGNPVFESIAELTPLPTFIRQVGFRNVPLLMHLTVMVVCALSFLLPLVWRAWVRMKSGEAEVAGGRDRRNRGRNEAGRRRKVRAPRWELSPFRLMLFACFSLLSWKATRNSHQFAAVVGAVTGWNFGEWAAAIRQRRREQGKATSLRASAIRRSAALVVVAAVAAWVGSGAYFDFLGEGRTIGLGEKPLWFPHEAAQFAGRPGMPERFQCFHNGLAGVFVYHNGPQQKVFADARLEVIGPGLFAEYEAIQKQIAGDEGAWQSILKAQGDPGIFVDLIQATPNRVAATLLADPGFACVYLDPIAAVFVPTTHAAARAPVDFLARHFHPGPETDPRGTAALIASARALNFLAGDLLHRSRLDLARPLILLGHGYAHRAAQLDSRSADAWKQLGLLESARITTEMIRNLVTPAEFQGRAGAPFDPILDLSTARATYALRRADQLRPGDFTTLARLAEIDQSRGMREAALPLLESLVDLAPANETQILVQSQTAAQLPRIRADLGPPPSTSWKNVGELERAVTLALERGRVETAAELLETAYQPRERSWEMADRMATLRLHLGQPDRARTLWQSAARVPRPGLRDSRVALTFLIEEDYEAARIHFREALKAEPDLFDAHYGLAVLEADAGRRDAAIQAGRAAVEIAPTEVAARAARGILSLAEGE